MKTLSFALSLIACVASIAGAVASVPSDPSLPNFAQVAPGLYRGAAPAPAGLARLKRLGVTTIIDLRISPKLVAKEKSEARQLGFRFVNLPMGSDPPTAAQTAAFLAAANNAAAQPVFVHCQHGADRTGCMFGIYRVSHDHWSYDRAYAEMRRYGFKPYYTKLSGAVKQRSAS